MKLVNYILDGDTSECGRRKRSRDEGEGMHCATGRSKEGSCGSGSRRLELGRDLRVFSMMSTSRSSGRLPGANYAIVYRRHIVLFSDGQFYEIGKVAQMGALNVEPDLEASSQRRGELAKVKTIVSVHCERNEEELRDPAMIVPRDQMTEEKKTKVIPAKRPSMSRRDI